MNLEEGDLVLCVVERIERTVVFVKVLLTSGEEIEGSIVTSEIAPGRIRNIRDYVVPKKKIVCKVLRISQSGNVELSFRRVTPKEKKEMMESEKEEKSLKSILKSVMHEKAEKIISEILKEEKLINFFQNAKQNPKKLEKIFGKKESVKIIEILNSQKEKKAILKKEITLKSFAPEGLEAIKEILGNVKKADVRYISAGKYLIKAESNSMKESDKIIKEIEEQIEKSAKKRGAEFIVQEK